MNRLLAGTPVLALVLGVGIAQADQVVGIVKGQPYTFEPAVKLTPAGNFYRELSRTSRTPSA